MRRALMIAMMLAAALSGCDASATPRAAGPSAAAPSAAGPSAAGAKAAGDWPDGVKEAEIYTAVLRRYLGTPGENSFPDRFTTVYLLDPHGVIAPGTRRQVTDALAGTATVSFIVDRDTVLEDRNGCPHVRPGGILINLGLPDGDDNDVKVFINGFVACLGATSMTYVVHRADGTGWRVTGTTGQMTIS